MIEKERKMFEVVINNKICEVWEREETHQLGRDNDKPDNLWVRYENQWEPWINIGVNNPCFEIKIKQNNRTKAKWNGLRINGVSCAEIYCNLRKVYEFYCNDLNYAFAKSQVLMRDMLEHPFNFMDPDSEIGRKIWFKGQSSIVERLLLDQGCIMIKKESGVFDLVEPWYSEEDIGLDDWHNTEEVKDDVFSSNIWWFRD